MSVQRKPPLPTAQAFLVCKAVHQDPTTRMYSLEKICDAIGLNFFPAGYPVSVYAYLTGGHGVYELALELRDAEGTPVWAGRWSDPLEYCDPLKSQQLAVNNTVIAFPAPGRFDLVLLANGEDLAHHGLAVSHLSPR
jgi:hypothetical protein